MKIGVLALQGDFAEHIHKLSGLGVVTAEVRLPADLEGLAGLILPGGESTTIGKLAEDFGLVEPLRSFCTTRAVWGTCAGAIFLARDAGRKQPLLGVMDITVERNAFGRQVDSFEADLDIPALASPGTPAAAPVHVAFIRAPAILKTGAGVEVLARLTDGTIVAARQGRWLATCFHTEITADDRLHKYFLRMAETG
jgi:pyridoxal 5'-phosphate synthase pdxT subunit